MDYTIFYKTSYDNGKLDCKENYDLFFSAFDDCERTKVIYDAINSTKKFWIDFPHYKHENLNIDNLYKCNSLKEDECFIDLFSQIDLQSTTKICIDITGFIRPHLIFFIISLYRSGIKKIDFLYSEPQHYKNAEETQFSGFIDEVRIIEGCSSEQHFTNTDNDILIVAAGYDDKLIAKVCQDKGKIKKKYYILGFPSLQPDMYQESILKIYQAQESIGSRIDKYAPAFDPFVTAQAIEEIICENPEHSNIYLSPLSTKPQTLGIALYYIFNFSVKPINILFPYSNTYFPKTATGIKKTWKYTFELP
ncbi:hypothetical protein [Pedobacter sp. CFBP9032]|uniref:hypothetical protein n=1 Tax=Pedobacter sp. CFBP9032 TaxID=3096539 RepID=UPI002A6AF07A|nr:hypothetical protein [Pedobacter sp. CFBP9032]MDY0903894.1 hypothetical protein [Pedobacter sp. CFBP9032]